MSDYVIFTVEIVLAVTVGILAGHGAVFVFNRMPAEWLCDYNEKPPEALKDVYTQRIKGYPWKLVFSGFFTAGAINTVIYDWQYAAAAVLFSWALLIIAAADKKYGIIPDQFVILTAVSALGFIPSHDSFWDPVLGAAAGGGIMLAVAGLGKLIFRQDSLGFGDVKLFAASGLALGVEGTFSVLIMSALISAVVFSVLLAKKKIKRTDSMPLGPYICGAAIFFVAIIRPLL